MNTYSCTECSADQLALRHALGDEIDIRQAGLWDRYCADLEHSRRRVYPPERTRGPLSRLHGERWAAEYQATMRQRDRLVWILACDFAREHDVPAGSDRSPHHAEQFLAAIRPLLAQRSVSLLLGNYPGASGLFLRLPDDDGPFLVRQLLAAYPDCSAEPLAADRLTPPQPVASARLLLRPNVLPLAHQKDFEDTLRRELFDPLASLLAAVGGSQPERYWAWLEIELATADVRRVRRARRFVERVLVARWWPEWLVTALLIVSEGRGLSPMLLRCLLLSYYVRGRPATAPEFAAGSEAAVQSAVAKLLTALFEVRVSVHAATGDAAVRAVAERVQAALEPLARYELSTWKLRPRDARRRSPTMLLVPGEIATLWHPPTETVRNPGLD